MFPALALGLFISGIIHEFIPDEWVERYLGGNGVKGIFFATLIGAIVPVCCWGSLPIAVTFKKKGASLGPVFSFLTATPATSVNALIVTWKFLGFYFMLYIFAAVIVIGMLMGLLGNMMHTGVSYHKKEVSDPEQGDCPDHCVGSGHQRKDLMQKIKSIFRYACIDMPKEIGLETLLGLALAAFVVSFHPIGAWIQHHLSQGYGYIFALCFGLFVYMCATMSVPIVHAFTTHGLSMGAGMSLLILGPIVSYGTILVLRKEFGIKVLAAFLLGITSLSLLAGYLFSLFQF
jgi:uncharacterized membrane protein YraQ (UPF0718 family)